MNDKVSIEEMSNENIEYNNIDPGLELESYSEKRTYLDNKGDIYSLDQNEVDVNNNSIKDENEDYYLSGGNELAEMSNHSDYVQQEIIDFNNKINEEAIYVMTIDLHAGLSVNLKIYHDTDPSHLASSFCENFNLLEDTYEYLVVQIDKLMSDYYLQKNNLNEANSSNLDYNQQDSLENYELKNHNLTNKNAVPIMEVEEEGYSESNYYPKSNKEGISSVGERSMSKDDIKEMDKISNKQINQSDIESYNIKNDNLQNENMSKNNDIQNEIKNEEIKKKFEDGMSINKDSQMNSISSRSNNKMNEESLVKHKIKENNNKSKINSNFSLEAENIDMQINQNDHDKLITIANSANSDKEVKENQIKYNRKYDEKINKLNLDLEKSKVTKSEKEFNNNEYKEIKDTENDVIINLNDDNDIYSNENNEYIKKSSFLKDEIIINGTVNNTDSNKNKNDNQTINDKKLIFNNFSELKEFYESNFLKTESKDEKVNDKNDINSMSESVKFSNSNISYNQYEKTLNKTRDEYANNLSKTNDLFKSKLNLLKSNRFGNNNSLSEVETKNNEKNKGKFNPLEVKTEKEKRCNIKEEIHNSKTFSPLFLMNDINEDNITKRSPQEKNCIKNINSTIKPALTSSSKEINKNKNVTRKNSKNIFERLYIEAELKRKIVTSDKVKENIKNSNKNSIKLKSKSKVKLNTFSVNNDYGNHLTKGEELYYRGLKKIEETNNKIIHNRQAKLDNDLKECSFKPNIYTKKENANYSNVTTQINNDNIKTYVYSDIMLDKYEKDVGISDKQNLQYRLNNKEENNGRNNFLFQTEKYYPISNIYSNKEMNENISSISKSPIKHLSQNRSFSSVSNRSKISIYNSTDYFLYKKNLVEKLKNRFDEKERKELTFSPAINKNFRSFSKDSKKQLSKDRYKKISPEIETLANTDRFIDSKLSKDLNSTTLEEFLAKQRSYESKRLNAIEDLKIKYQDIVYNKSFYKENKIEVNSNKEYFDKMLDKYFFHIFKLLDSDEDNSISRLFINIKNLKNHNEKVLKIISPLLNELINDDETLNAEEFNDSMRRLYKVLNIYEKNEIIEFGKKMSRNDNNLMININNSSKSPFKNSDKNFLDNRQFGQIRYNQTKNEKN